MKKILRFILMLAAVTTLAACGGGGGGGAFLPAAHQPTAVVALSTAGTGTIYGIDVTVNLPAGVTLRTVPGSQETAGGVVAASGVALSGTMTSALYTGATGTWPGRVRIMAVNANGFTTGQYCTMNGTIAPGSVVTALGFSFADFSASDQNGNVISGLTPSFTLEIR